MKQKQKELELAKQQATQQLALQQQALQQQAIVCIIDFFSPFFLLYHFIFISFFLYISSVITTINFTTTSYCVLIISSTLFFPFYFWTLSFLITSIKILISYLFLRLIFFRLNNKDNNKYKPLWLNKRPLLEYAFILLSILSFFSHSPFFPLFNFFDQSQKLHKNKC